MVSAAVNTHAIQNANTYDGSLSGSDYTNVRNVHQSLLSDCLNKRLDTPFMNAVSSVTPTQILSASLDRQPILDQIQIFSPEYSADTLQLALNAIPMDYDSVSIQLSALQQFGLSWHYRKVYNLCGTLLSGSDSATSSSDSLTSTARPHPNFQPLPLPQPSGGGGYNCKKDSAAVLATGTALSVIALMAGPFGVLSEVAFWGALTLYGGVGSTAWGIGHAAVCGL